MRGAIYWRPLPEDRNRVGFSSTRLKERCARRAYRLDAGEVVEFSDRDFSNETLQRPGIILLRVAVKRKLIDLLVCDTPDCLSRHLPHRLLLSVEMERAGVRLEFLNQGWWQSPEGRQLYAIQQQVLASGLDPVRYFTLLYREFAADLPPLSRGAGTIYLKWHCCWTFGNGGSILLLDPQAASGNTNRL